MNPAFSVIFFTTASGAGYGLLALLGLLAPGGMLPGSVAFGLVGIGIALALITVGLLASALHLGHPERAMKALSQWRTSWLSREGVAALVTYVPALLFAYAWATGGPLGGATAAFGIASAVMALVTVFCTGMIYASLKPIRQWNTPLVTRNYILFSAFSGAVCLAALAAAFGWPGGLPSMLAVLLGLAALFAKLRYWRFIDGGASATTIETATGLGKIGPVRMLESPNTQDNYLLKEMGFRVGRKHAARLRRIALLAGFVAPALLLLLALASGGALALLATLGAVVLAALGLVAERWLFFAEATHTVALYYGRTI